MRRDKKDTVNLRDTLEEKEGGEEKEETKPNPDGATRVPIETLVK